jgi:hypothetical protein
VDTLMANPARLGEQVWVAYPSIDGRCYDGSRPDIAASGVTRANARRQPTVAACLTWPEYTNEAIEKDATDLAASLRADGMGRRADPVPSRLVGLLTDFRSRTLPRCGPPSSLRGCWILPCRLAVPQRD